MRSTWGQVQSLILDTLTFPAGLLHAFCPAPLLHAELIWQMPYASQVLCCAGDGLFEVALENEERDLWRAFLEREDYAAARRYATSQV